MNTKALYNLSYGVYLLSARDGERDNACIINTAVQVANNPVRISIAAIKGNLTHDMIAETGRFNLSAITTDASFELFKHFGMQSGRNVDKFADFTDVERSANGLYYLTKCSNAFMSVEVRQSYDLGSHTLFIGELTDAEVLASGECCTYSYYQNVIKKKAPKATVQKGWKCSVCSYVYEGENLPDDYICPVCKHGAEDFERIAPAAAEEKKYVCPVCGYVYKGVRMPDDFVCPTCHVPGSRFTERSGEMSLAAEHIFGVAADVSEDMKKELLSNFEGECSEVGMYFCMARIASREGYPEIANYWDRAARDEAEHAAKFAELLGGTLEPNMKASTRENLAWRVDCEFGATAGKVELATKAKQLGLDAIHDTVHEMARDEARHGKALKGLLEKYFK